MRKEILLNDNWLFHKGEIRVDRPADKGPVYSQSKTQRKLTGPAAYKYFDNPDPYWSTGELKDDGWRFVQLPHDSEYMRLSILEKRIYLG